jgi:hypothetical protein
MKDFFATLKKTPSTKLFLMHPYNRRLIEGYDGCTGYEIEQLKKACSFAVLTALQIIAGLYGLIIFFDIVWENFNWIWLLAFVPIFTTGVFVQSYFEFDLQRQLRTHGTVVAGRIIDFEIKGGDSITAVATYEFITPTGETVKARTKELPYKYDAHFYISRSRRKFTLMPELIKPEMDGRVIVLYLNAREQNLFAYEHDIL